MMRSVPLSAIASVAVLCASSASRRKAGGQALQKKPQHSHEGFSPSE